MTYRGFGEEDLAPVVKYGSERPDLGYKGLACPPKIGPLEMRDSCRIRTGGSICENEKVFGGAGIQDSQRG